MNLFINNPSCAGKKCNKAGVLSFYFRWILKCGRAKPILLKAILSNRAIEVLIVDWNNVSLICKTEFSYKCLKTILSPKNKPLLFASAKWIGPRTNRPRPLNILCSRWQILQLYVLLKSLVFWLKKAVYFVNIMLISWWAKSLKLLSS